MGRAKWILAAAVVSLWLTVTSAAAAEIPVLAYYLSESQSIGLPGAVFTLTTPEGQPVCFRPTGQAWTVSQVGETQLATGSNGFLRLTGLAPGQYLLCQQSAPGLYRQLDEPLLLTVEDDGTMLAKGVRMESVSILHRSGLPVLTAAMLAVCALLPAAVRVIWLWRGRQGNS